jgi:predicted metal-dependent hydrolase
MARTAHVDLPDGRRLEYEVRTSARSKSVRLKITARDGLTVTAPQGVAQERIADLVAVKGDWILGRLNHFDEMRHLLGEHTPTRPQAFDLAADAESWRVEYRETRGKTVGARTDRMGRVLVFGAVGDPERCQAALRRWLARRAREVLDPWLESLSEQTGLKFDKLLIKAQRTRWGSCSISRAISLNCKLLFLPRELVRYVLIHELCHTVVRNHTTRFWAMVRQFEPRVDALHGSMRDAWKLIPGWAHPIRTKTEGL